MLSNGVYEIDGQYCKFAASGVWLGYVSASPEG